MTSALATSSDTRLHRVRAVCLDIDDTLVDYCTSARTGLVELLGDDQSWPMWQRTSERHHARYAAGEVDFDTMRRQRTRAFLTDLGRQVDEEEAAAWEQRRLTATERTWTLFDDAVPCLRWLRGAGLRVAAITNAAGAYQRRKLAAVGLDGAFDRLVISGERGVAKPDPLIFHTACAELGVRPEEAVHVGDKVTLDALGARDAGLHGVWLDRSSLSDPVPPGISVISGLSELPDLLFRLGTPAS
ncbi:HAD family hydrolase [Actinoalloteichus spitiensis]|uniref:HAD family hydrolase n=1 Tax=Actinoalloteichus spitiensis TaxID=252394 RepID=UPI0003688209|nr:HAD family hydrolase [Actinoalloteichus spitiensis]